MKHTPGDWHISSENDGDGYNIRAGKDYIGHTVGYYPRPGSNERTLSTDEALANATLMAAAPELLAALKTCADWLSRSMNVDDLEMAADARAAIARAEGGGE